MASYLCGMNVLLLGGGGREHALAWKMAQSPKLSQLYIAPGNAGTLQHGKNIDLPITDPEAVTAWAGENNIDLVVSGQRLRLYPAWPTGSAKQVSPQSAPALKAPNWKEVKTSPSALCSAMASYGGIRHLHPKPTE